MQNILVGLTFNSSWLRWTFSSKAHGDLYDFNSQKTGFQYLKCIVSGICLESYNWILGQSRLSGHILFIWNWKLSRHLKIIVWILTASIF